VPAGSAELYGVDRVDAVELALLDLVPKLDEELPLPDVWSVASFEQRITNTPRVADEDMLERVRIA
jgi:hypothetical protein